VIRYTLQVIRDLQNDTKSETKEYLQIRSQLPRGLDADGGDVIKLPADTATLLGGSASRSEHPVKSTLRLSLSFIGAKSASNVTVRISTPSFVTAIPSSIVLPQVAGGKATPTVINIALVANRTFVPSSLDLKIVATYTVSTGEPRVATHIATIPLIMACRLKQASKTAIHKITLETPEGAIGYPLNDLFRDYLTAYQDCVGGDLGDLLDASSGAKSLGFQFWCNMNQSDSERTQSTSMLGSASIIVSKTGDKYRIQADSLSCLSVISAELSRRLTIRLRETSSSAAKGDSKQPKRFLAVNFIENLPLDPYFALISEHFALRLKSQEYLSEMNDAAHQYRMIEKRLLTRFKEKTASALSGLDVLMKETFSNLMMLGDKVEMCKSSILRLSSEIEASSRLITLLAHLKFDMSPLEHAQLEAYFCPDLQTENSDQGWEEIVDAGLMYLLRTSLAKNSKDTAFVSTQFEPLDNVEKLTKHISMVFDRISKGGRLIKLKTKEPSVL
jgi:Bardet-Biedl syndrome 9 protein